MAVNDRLMLPPLLLAMPEIADLLQAEEAELQRLASRIAREAAQLWIMTATDALPRYERIVGLPAAPELSDGDRRNRIIGKLNTRTPATLRATQELAELVTGCPCTVTERYAQYAFGILVQLSDSTATDSMRTLHARLMEYKPAHLAYDVTAQLAPVALHNHNALYLHKVRYQLHADNLAQPCIRLDGSRPLDGTWQLNQRGRKCVGLSCVHIRATIHNPRRTDARTMEV